MVLFPLLTQVVSSILRSTGCTVTPFAPATRSNLFKLLDILSYPLFDFPSWLLTGATPERQGGSPATTLEYKALIRPRLCKSQKWIATQRVACS